MQSQSDTPTPSLGTFIQQDAEAARRESPWADQPVQHAYHGTPHMDGGSDLYTGATLLGNGEAHSGSTDSPVANEDEHGQFTPMANRIYALLVGYRGFYPGSRATLAIERGVPTCPGSRDAFNRFQRLAAVHPMFEQRDEVSTVFHVTASALYGLMKPKVVDEELLECIVSAATRTTPYWIAISCDSNWEKKTLYGSISHLAYAELRKELLYPGSGGVPSFNELARRIAAVEVPLGSSVDRLLLLNGSRHPLDPKGHRS